MSNPLEQGREQKADQRFVEAIAEHFRPQPFEPTQRARFDTRLRERLARRNPVRSWIPALAGVAVALALVWSFPSVPAVPGTPTESVARAPVAASWESDVLLVDADSTLAEEEYLPADYQVIAFAFIDGV